MEINPYQSPAEECSEPLSPVPPLNRLRVPTIGLILLSGITLIAYMHAAYVLTLVVFHAPAPPNGFENATRQAVWCFVSLISNATVLFGAIKARGGKSYRWAMAAAILACIPFLSPLFYFGIPLGIWLLVALRRQDVRACFAANPNRL